MKMYTHKAGNKAMYGRAGRTRMGRGGSSLIKSPAQVRSRAARHVKR